VQARVSAQAGTWQLLGWELMGIGAVLVRATGLRIEN